MTATIVYDWNGTLLDDAHLVAAGFNAVFKHFGHAELSLGRFREVFDYPTNTFCRKIGFTEEELKKNFSDMMIMFSEVYEGMADKASLRDGVVETLEGMRKAGVKQIILSNHLRDKIIRQLKRTGVFDFFEVVLAHKDVNSHIKMLKKEDFIASYISENELNPGNLVCIGDSFEEVEFSRRLGMKSVSVTGGLVSEARLREAMPDCLIHSLSELGPVLAERGFV